MLKLTDFIVPVKNIVLWWYHLSIDGYVRALCQAVHIDYNTWLNTILTLKGHHPADWSVDLITNLPEGFH